MPIPSIAELQEDANSRNVVDFTTIKFFPKSVVH